MWWLLKRKTPWIRSLIHSLLERDLKSCCCYCCEETWDSSMESTFPVCSLWWRKVTSSALVHNRTTTIVRLEDVCQEGLSSRMAKIFLVVFFSKRNKSWQKVKSVKKLVAKKGADSRAFLLIFFARSKEVSWHKFCFVPSFVFREIDELSEWTHEKDWLNRSLWFSQKESWEEDLNLLEEEVGSSWVK